MTSIYQQALGAEFLKLHPRIRERFGFNSHDRIASIGHGVMERIWFAKWTTVPLYIGASRHIMFPQGGRQVPFTIRNYAYVDGFGRETVTWNREFYFANKIRNFDATMIYSDQRQGIIDYMGIKQHLAVDLSVSVEANGGIRIRSGDQRFYEGWLQFRFPRLFTGIAEVCEWYDDEVQRYKISVEIHNPLLGTVFSYHGSFQADFIDTNLAAIPLGIRPVREEKRE